MDKYNSHTYKTGKSPKTSSMSYSSQNKDSKAMENSTSGPTVVLLWVWNLFATLQKTTGEFLAKFSVLDAMMQFIMAVATSCHPQEEGFDGEEIKHEKSSPVKAKSDLKIFNGPGRTLRSRTIETES